MPGQALADPQKMGHAHLTDLQRLGLPAELDVTRGDPNAEGVLVTQDLLGWVLRSSSEPALRKQVLAVSYCAWLFSGVALANSPWPHDVQRLDVSESPSLRMMPIMTRTSHRWPPFYLYACLQC